MNHVDKLKITYKNGQVEIVGNREGLQLLAEVCMSLSELSDEEAKTTSASHYHFADYMNNAEKGSVPTKVVYRPDL
ncbi:MAG: hypothetical protein ACE5I0_08080 [Candidatus Binatia bacterium]